MDFNFEGEEGKKKKVKHDIMLTDTEDKRIFYDKLRFIYLEMPNFNKELKDLKNHFEKWLYLLKNLPKLDRIPKELKDKIFMKVFATSKIASYSTEELNEYQSSLKTYTDLKNSLDTAFEEGEIKGREAVTVNLLKEGMSDDFIQKVTGLSLTEIENIRVKYNLPKLN